MTTSDVRVPTSDAVAAMLADLRRDLVADLTEQLLTLRETEQGRRGMLKPGEAAAFLGVSDATFRDLQRRGLVEPTGHVGTMPRYDPDYLRELVKAGRLDTRSEYPAPMRRYP